MRHPRPEIVITLDVGGSSVKVSAFDTAAHHSLGQHAVAYDPRSWTSDGELDLESWWITSVTALSSLIGRLHLEAGDVCGITVGAVRIPFVLLDAHDRIIRPCITNADRRAAVEATWLLEALGDRLYDQTGHWAAPEFGLAKILWLRAHEPEAWADAAHVLQLHDWFVFQLCGTQVSEASSAAMSQMVDPTTGGWAEDLLDDLGISTSLLPELRPAGSKGGALLETIAARIGVTAGVSVHIGGGDTQLSALGAGSLNACRPLVVVAGSTAPVQLVASRPAESSPTVHPLLVSPHFSNDDVTYEANAGVVGTTVEKLFGLVTLRGEPLRSSLIRAGFHLSSSDGRRRRPAVLVGNPRFSPGGWAHAPAPSVVGLSEEHTGADVLAAALEGSCLTLKRIIAVMHRLIAEELPPIVATGGMSGNPSWAQTLAQVVGVEVVVPDTTATAGVAGAALVSGQSVTSLLDGQEHAARYAPEGGDLDFNGDLAELDALLESRSGADTAQRTETQLSSDNVTAKDAECHARAS